jgi:uncharacterized glyoxalase superfamily protein PhnB
VHKTTFITKTYRPKGFSTLSPYLVLKDISAFLDFSQKILGARILEQTVSNSGVIKHAALKIGNSVLMVGAGWQDADLKPGYMHLYIPNVDATYQLAIQAGSTTIETPVMQPYGDYRAAFQDRWGNVWWIAQHRQAAQPKL